MERKKEIRTEVVAEGKWLTLNDIYYESNGREHKWESADRKGKRGAVAIIAVLHPSERIVIIKQYRPPLNAYVYEFPAGLIDSGEAADKTALRELYEETGYKGKIEKIYPPVFNSPGMTSESIYLAICGVDERNPENKNPCPCLEGTEDIETVLVNKKELLSFLEENAAKGVCADSKLMSYAIAQSKD